MSPARALTCPKVVVTRLSPSSPSFPSFCMNTVLTLSKQTKIKYPNHRESFFCQSLPLSLEDFPQKYIDRILN